MGEGGAARSPSAGGRAAGTRPRRAAGPASTRRSATARPQADTGFRGFPRELFAFYAGLAAENSKAYWTQHRPVYDRVIRPCLLALAADLEPEYGPSKIYRPNRDTRFGADKSPYKLHTGLYAEPATDIYYYVNVDAGGMLTGAGLHPHSRRQTAAYRAAVDDATAGAALAGIVAALAGAGLEVGGETVRTRPRGVPADHPRLDLLRHESLYVRRYYTLEDWFGTGRELDVVRADWHTMRPLNEWMRRHLGGAG